MLFDRILRTMRISIRRCSNNQSTKFLHDRCHRIGNTGKKWKGETRFLKGGFFPDNPGSLQEKRELYINENKLNKSHPVVHDDHKALTVSIRFWQKLSFVVRATIDIFK